VGEPEDKGFSVKDRRIFTGGDAGDAAPAGTCECCGEADARSECGETAGLPEGPFSRLVIGLGSAALLHLGAIPNPETNKTEVNLPLAQETIDLLGVLQDKTSGRLTREEDSILAHILRDLRLRYVAAAKPPQR
jgi:hypothetical protein